MTTSTFAVGDRVSILGAQGIERQLKRIARVDQGFAVKFQLDQEESKAITSDSHVRTAKFHAVAAISRNAAAEKHAKHDHSAALAGSTKAHGQSKAELKSSPEAHGNVSRIHYKLRRVT